MSAQAERGTVVHDTGVRGVCLDQTRAAVAVPQPQTANAVQRLTGRDAVQVKA